MSENGINKAAVLMLALGQDRAAEVMKYLDSREVQKVGSAMAVMSNISEDTLNDVLDSFSDEMSKTTALGINSEEYIRGVLTSALGEEDAGFLIGRILDRRGSTGIDSLKSMESKAVADLIENEHPQIIATILVHLPRFQASAILAELPLHVRNDVVLRIATLDGVQPAALNELNDVLTKLLTISDNSQKRDLGGVRVTAEIMNFLNGDTESSVMNGLKEFNPELAQLVKDNMFVFEDIMTLDDKNVQSILAEVSSDVLVIALKGVKDELQEKILNNMSQRAAETLREDLETKGPVRVAEVEAQQREILQVINRMIEEGKINLKVTDDDYV
ncbi:flagellar motor switch protein G [Polynucleobacter sp. SHI8]|uniref:flagellar motor switch protein FliG n=1 Tax=unclassified Polynucleobacter TaxID=2640945 RepID=UPI00249175D9|nr:MULTISPECIES: flagellar motor switch protein FliG [unclassified Polynucleobacter]BDW11755.1 flagellar motor switch protein G [Polynucleobacter sp. SHI2]BDW14202.1 flagellar motor switch protein G [Polynucleobacter sp. SHI8]